MPLSAHPYVPYVLPIHLVLMESNTDPLNLTERDNLPDRGTDRCQINITDTVIGTWSWQQELFSVPCGTAASAMEYCA